ncbi:hypothetical protein [Candidatus Raskinella chloraquaticus]|jgi:hypothetical protein|uniref:Uncharacterized protein n=1 Tax=Candidatus Raskinella chloraquaticus TaxID=1951219 RepID=A0A1W9HQE5_9HYPH|nr:MAG: hypothetical protein A4S15_02615 [Proteobacteria bacterium SG_bin8]
MRVLLIGSVLSLTLVFGGAFLSTSWLMAPPEAVRVKTADRLPSAGPLHGSRTFVIQLSSLSRHVTCVWRAPAADRKLASASLSR